jgi:hypothetical protein
MSRRQLILRLTKCLIVAAALMLAVGGAEHATAIVINNGLDCSNPENVIADDTYSGDSCSSATSDAGSHCH